MNEFEHFVLHAALWLAGISLGSTALAALLWSALKLSAPLRRRVVDPPVERGARRSPLMPRNLVLFGLLLMGATTTLLASHHGLLPQPTWLARVTPFQHFLLHLGYVLAGVFLAFAWLSAWGRSLLDLLRRERSWRARDEEVLSQRRAATGFRAQLPRSERR